MTTTRLTPTHLPAGPVRLAWLASFAIHALVLAAPLGLSLMRPAPEPTVNLQVRLVAPARSPVAPEMAPPVQPPVQPSAQRPAAASLAPVATASPVIALAPDVEPVPSSHRVTEAPASAIPVAAVPVRPASAAIAPESMPAAASRSVEVVHVPPRFDAAYLDNPPPPYPRMARSRGEQGLVVVAVAVGADGRPLHCTLHRSSGFPALDDAALRTIRTWRFVPARRGEQTVAETVLVPMPFRLTEAADAGRESTARAS
jgi:periplasmic protein TonB